MSCFLIVVRWWGPSDCEHFGPFNIYEEALKCAEKIKSVELKKLDVPGYDKNVPETIPFLPIRYIVLETYPIDYVKNPDVYTNKQSKNEFVYHY